MKLVTETPKAEASIKRLGLWRQYLKQKKNFIEHPELKSLDICFWDKKNRIMSFKITSKYRVKYRKGRDGNYFVFEAGDFHK